MDCDNITKLQEENEVSLSFILNRTRQENGGISIVKIARIIKNEFSPEEVEVIIRELNKLNDEK